MLLSNWVTNAGSISRLVFKLNRQDFTLNQHWRLLEGAFRMIEKYANVHRQGPEFETGSSGHGPLLPVSNSGP